MQAHRSSAVPLAGVAVVLVVYASLYPFDGWRWPPGQGLPQLLALPWPRFRTGFDDWSNLLGYLPLGALMFAAVARTGGRRRVALLLGLLGPGLLSYVLEVTQHFVPGRVPSLRDLALNGAGGAVGALVGLGADASGLLDRWQRVRERWFVPHSGGAIALLLLWPVALLFPSPVPLGLGQVFGELRALAEAVVSDSALADPVAAWLARPSAPAAPLPPFREGLAIALGLLAPALLATVVTRPGWRRVVMAVGGLAVAVAATTLSTLLNFGPSHAFTWITPVALPALAAGAVMSALVAASGPRLAAALGLIVLTALVAIVAEAPGDPYYAASLQGWEQGRFIRFHGLAQWIGWLWPYAAMVWLLARLVRRD